MGTQPLLDLNPQLEVGEQLNLAQLPGGPVPPTPQLATGSPVGRLKWINDEVCASEKHVHPYRDKAREASRFVAGNQLDDATRRELKEKRRPDTAFNTLQLYLRYVSGLERRAPQALLFLPMVIDNRVQQLMGDFVTNSVDWAVARANITLQRSRVFDDMLTGGMGWSDRYLDKLKDPRGLIESVRIPWDETYWPLCQEDNLATTRWRAWETWVEKDEALRRWPSHSGLITAAAGTSENKRSYPQQDVTYYTIPYVQSVPIDQGQPVLPEHRNKVKVLQFQWYEDQPGFAFTDPITKEPVWLNSKDFLTYQRRLQVLMPTVRVMPDRVHHRVVMSTHILNRLYELDEPMRLPDDLFTLQCLTGHWDHEMKQWYGFVRLLMDPQRYANAFFRQALETIAVSAKGGAMVQSDAFLNNEQLRNFVNGYSTPGSVNIVAPEAIEKHKIQPKTPGELPQAAVAMLQFCVKSMEAVTGLSAQSMGFDTGGEGSAMTMRQGQQVGRIILAKEFDNLSLYRKEEGKGIFSLLKLIADGRLIRVGGDYASQAIPLMRQPFLLEYDLFLDDTEHDPNLRTMYQNFILQAGPMLAKQGLFVPEMLDYLPFPAKIRQKMIQAMMASQQQQQQAAAAGINLRGRGAPRDPRETQARIMKLQSDALLHAERAKNIPRESRREDFRTVVDAMSRATTHRLDERRHGLDRERHVAQTGHETVRTITELLSALNSPQGATQ